MIVKCNLAGTGKCDANKKDNSWLIGYIYCDHGIEHDLEDVCNLKCQINSDKKCMEVKK